MSTMTLEQVKQRLLSEQAHAIDGVTENVGELTVNVHETALLSLCQTLKSDFGFEQLVDLCGVDYLHFGQENWETESQVNQGFSRGVFDFDDAEDARDDMPNRFAVVYHLLSIQHNLRLRLKVYPHNTQAPMVPSVISVWNVADWYEREAFDLYGIVFENHPDLRRILTDYGFIGHPLRKDFPLQGHVEMRYDPAKGRVVYEPVTIENRVNVPKVVR